MSHDIFLSYSHKDSRMMRRIRADLEAAGLRVWTDEGIPVGSPLWKEEVEEAIRSACIFLILLSPDANQSKWVRRELDFAEMQGLKIFSVLLHGDRKDAVPISLVGSQHIDLRTSYRPGVQKLTKAIHDHIATHSAPTLIKRPHPRQVRRFALIATLTVCLMLGGMALVTLIQAPPSVVQAMDATVRPQPTATMPMPQVRTISEIVPTTASADRSFPLLLSYDGEILTLTNQDRKPQNIRDLEFRLMDGSGLVFESNDWEGDLGSLGTDQCVQAWGLSLGYIPREPRAPCEVRVRYRATNRVFWVSAMTGTQFEIWRYGERLGQCVAVRVTSREVQQCGLTLN